jgi:biopolymer transport protein TolR
MTPYRIKRHRKRAHSSDGHLALVPFIDMMMILVVFLLVHTADVDILPNTKSISIPQSISEQKPSAAVVVMVTRDTIYVDGVPVGTLQQVAASQDLVIAPLKAALISERERTLSRAAKADIKKREVTIMGDKSTPFKILKKIMATCTEADYGKVSLAVVERERAAST